MRIEDLTLQAQELIALAGKAITQTYEGSYERFVKSEPFTEFRSAGLSFFRRAFGSDHPYYAEFDTATKRHVPTSIEKGRGILSAAHGELQRGWIASTRQLVAAEIFGDFLEMADYLIGEGYKDPAAVVAGAVLEEHLRKLADKFGIEITIEKSGDHVPKRADQINSELVKCGAYSKLDQKSVTAWLDLRNKAAHGRFDEYTVDQVRLLAQGVRDFISRNQL